MSKWRDYPDYQGMDSTSGKVILALAGYVISVGYDQAFDKVEGGAWGTGCY